MAVRGVEVERRGQVGWILINDYQATTEAGEEDADFIGVHEGIGIAVDELRWDRGIRIVVITGRNDGEFYRFSRRTHWDDPRFKDRLNPLKGRGRGASQPQEGIHRSPDAHEALMLIEKPVIARVNGDAIGFGSSVLWGCDLVVAREDALIAWGHTGLGKIIDSNGEARGFPWAMTPSYGSVSILNMPPAKLKEWMFLSKVYTAREMADMNVINYAVPAAELDTTVNTLIDALLERPPFVLARTKKLINKRIREQYNLTEDLANAFTSLDVFTQAMTETLTT
jgi:enoyl-CoA hydratase/carnithine racemase